MKGILYKYQLNPTNCVFLGNIGYNAITAEKLDVKSYDAVDVLKKLNKSETLYHLGGREFFVNKILQNDIYILHQSYGEWAQKKFEQDMDELESSEQLVTLFSIQLKCDIIVLIYWEYMKVFENFHGFLAKEVGKVCIQMIV